MYHTRLYRSGTLELQDFPVADISDHIKEPDAVIWFDLCEPTEDDLTAISDELGLHPLAVEDAIHEHQRAKLDHYASHLFLTAYSLSYDTESAVLDSAEVAAFILPNALVTVRKDTNFNMDEVVRRWDEESELASNGVSFLLYGLLDYIVDTHFDAVQALDSGVEGLEDQLFSDNVQDTTMQKRTFQMRKSLVVARRIVLPMREILNSLLRRDLQIVNTTISPYYQDVYDHVMRVTEWTESLRELISNIYDTHLNIRGNRLNVVMKQVTGWAAVIAVPTAVTGWYGQNIPYPGFGHYSGLWTSIFLTVMASVGLYVMFRRKGWL